jgi:hypothetical protein
MEREQFKYLARKVGCESLPFAVLNLSNQITISLSRAQITETLVEKEARAADPSLRPTKETETKINKYIVAYMERLKAAPDYPANIKSAPPKGDKSAKEGR